MPRFAEGYSLTTRTFSPPRDVPMETVVTPARKRPRATFQPIHLPAPKVAKTGHVPLATVRRLVKDFSARQGCPLAVRRQRIDGELLAPEITGSRIAGLTIARIIRALDWHPEEAADRAWSWQRSFQRECADLRA